MVPRVLSWDSPERAADLALGLDGKIGHLIVRYDVPDGCGITWEVDPDDEHHFALYGDFHELKEYLVPDFCLKVDVPK